MRHVIGLVAGIVVGAAAALALLYYNPMAAKNPLSPLSVSEKQLMSLSYSAAVKDSIAYTNDGESAVHPHPAKILQLWEAPIRRTDVLVTVLADGRGNAAGIGIKMTSDSERTRLINGEALVDSVWHIHLPQRGSLFIAQTENYWNYLREIVVPAYWSSVDSWKGSWFGSTTAGPGPLGTARVAGGSGEFSRMDTEAVEAFSARAYSVADGPVSMDGHLTIELPGADAPVAVTSE